VPGFWDRSRFNPTAQELKRQQNFTSGALILLCRKLELDVRVSELRCEGFGWFHENYPDFPVHMEALKETINLPEFWTKPTKTDAWKAFFDLYEELQKPALGAILRVAGVGFGVFHTAWHLPSAPGHTRMERRSAISDKRGLILETMPAFVEATKSVWRKC